LPIGRSRQHSAVSQQEKDRAIKPPLAEGWALMASFSIVNRQSKIGNPREQP
jgi:hypothetical protein